MSPQGLVGQFGDTTYTKVFVGGLAWETQRETMKKYFEQFGDILEAVVITDKNTGRSKGYGFVTFNEPEAAKRACVEAAPVIDGRRANCNLAYLGVQKTKPTSPKNGSGRNTNMRVMKSFAAFPTSPTLPYYGIQHGVPYNVYGYSTYSPDYTYPTSFYNVYGGNGAQHPVYGGGSGVVTGTTSPFYPYYQFNHGGGAYAQGQPYGMHYNGIFSAMNSTSQVTSFDAQQYGGPVSLAPNPQTGMMMALTAPTLPTPHPYRLIPFHPSAVPEKPVA